MYLLSFSFASCVKKTERSFDHFQITENWFSLSFISDVFNETNSVTRSHVPYNVANIALSRRILNKFFSQIQGASKIA
jgi:hypothetical protein